MRRWATFAAAAALASWALCGVAAAGFVYDSQTDWEADGVQPDAGVWSYQWAVAADLDGDYTDCAYWTGSQWQGRVTGTTDPYPFITQTGNHPTWRVVAGDPNTASQDVGAIRTFDTPVGGLWHLTGYFEDTNANCGNGVLVGIFADEPTGDDTALLPFTHIQRLTSTPDDGVPDRIDYDLMVTLDVGQRLFFRTQSNSASSCDGTGERHHLEFIPEPTSLTLVGLGLLALARRRRRRA